METLLHGFGSRVALCKSLRVDPRVSSRYLQILITSREARSIEKLFAGVAAAVVFCVLSANSRKSSMKTRPARTAWRISRRERDVRTKLQARFERARDLLFVTGRIAFPRKILRDS